MSFGYGISDFIALSRLAWDVFQNLSKACGAHDDLTREAKSLHIVLQRLELEAAKPASLLNRKTDNRREELETLCSDCSGVLKVLQKILHKYNALQEEERSVRKLWQKIKFGNGEMQDLNELRLKIATSTQAISLFLNMLSIGSQGKVEQYMDSQGPELKEIKTSVNWIAAMLQVKSPGEGSILTSYTDDDKMFWKEFRRELVKEGYSSSVIKKHRDIIIKYVVEIGNRGILDDVEPAEENAVLYNSSSSKKIEAEITDNEIAVSDVSEVGAVSNEDEDIVNGKGINLEDIQADRQDEEEDEEENDKEDRERDDGEDIFVDKNPLPFKFPKSNQPLGSDFGEGGSTEPIGSAARSHQNEPITEPPTMKVELVCITDALHESDQNAKTEHKAEESSQPAVEDRPWSAWSWCEEGSNSMEQMLYRGRKDLNGEWEYDFAPLSGVQNFNIVETDRLNHMSVPADEPGQRPNRIRRSRPLNYNDELNQCRRQERADEELARRLQRLRIDYDDWISIKEGSSMSLDEIRAAKNTLAMGDAHALVTHENAQARNRTRP